jgi:acyl-CoA thioesterase-1
VVILALGANDGLRGLPVAAMKDNLQAMARQATPVRRARTAGRHAPAAQLRPAVHKDFDAAFRDVARAEKPRCCPSCSNPSRSNAMPSRPTACIRSPPRKPKLLDHVWAALKPLLG